ncbi:general substrate transporter [Colletotrichum asianum]
MVSVYSCLVIAAFCNPIGLDNIGWKYYIVFCCFLLFITFTVYFYFPETKGYTLEEIAVIFDGCDADLTATCGDKRGNNKKKDRRVDDVEL